MHGLFVKNMRTNKHIEKYLDYYCDHKNDTPFAVLLKGKWGCGKTYFIKKYIKDKRHFLHISLYGLSSNKEIDEKIFEALHPILSNPKVKLAAQAISGIVKYTTKIDFNNDGKDDFSIDSNGISKLNFKDFSKKSENKIIIFDDVERCDIEIGRLFGYVNHLVEFFDQKIILVANEEKFLKQGNAEKYREVKEKLIGREFYINSSHEEAIGLFVGNIRKGPLKKYSKKIESLLSNIFVQSGYDNLRLVQQALFHFEYFFKNFSSKAKNDPGLFERMFYEFVAIFIEYKKGNIKSEDFKEYPYFFKKEEGVFGEEVKGHFLDKYSYNLSSWLTCFNVPILGKILHGIGLFQDEMKQMIDNFEDLAGTNKESWQNLWYCYDRDDKDFFDNLQDVLKRWEKGEYFDFLVVLHVYGMFLGFSKEGLLEKNKNDIFEEGKEYIEKLIKDKRIPLNIREQNIGFSWRESAYGLGYSGMQNREWKKLIEFVDKQLEDLRGDYIKQKIDNELMPILRNEKPSGDLPLFMNYNFLHYSGNKESYFQYFNTREIANILVSGDRLLLRVLQKTFNERYSNMKDQIAGIEQEIPFLKELKKELENEIKKIENKFGKKKTPRSILLRGFINNAIKPFI